MSDIRIYIFWLFLGMASGDKLFFYMGLFFIMVDTAVDVIKLWRSKK